MPAYLADLITIDVSEFAANLDSVFARIKSALQFEIAYSINELIEKSVNSESYFHSPDYHGCDGFLPTDEIETDVNIHIDNQFAFDAIQIARLSDLIVITVYSYSPPE
jgi:hypothetical protein